MTLGIRGKLFFGACGIVIGALVIANLHLSPSLDRDLTAGVSRDLSVRLELVEREVSRAGFAIDDRGAWDGLADELAVRAHARVTIIRADGAVLGDSEVAPGDLAALESHAGRPEVRAALAAGHGESSRLSTTVQQRLMYAARPFVRGAERLGVVRLSTPLAAVDAALAELRLRLAGSALIALAVAALLAAALGRRLAAAIEQLHAAAVRMTAGDLHVRTHLSGRDELAHLGQALDRMAGSLAGAVDALRGERDLLRGILAGMHEGVLVLGDEGRVRLVNPALREMLLLGDIVGKLPLEAIRHAELQAILDQARTSHAAVSAELELAGIKPRRLLVHASPFPDSPEGLLIVFVDVTEIRRLESLRRDFVANVSHELRTPVTAIRSATETLRDAARADPAAGERFMDIIDRNAERLQRLVEDLLDLSRLDSRQYRLDLERLELGPLLTHAATLFGQAAGDKRIAIEVSSEAGAGAALVDRRAMEQVLTNLVDNAVKYCPAGSHITVRAFSRDGQPCIEVGDDGPGIEERHLPRLFERFYRVDAGRSRDVGGTGLGLSIVKHLVEAMGGTVAVASAPGGTRFTVAFPAPS